MNLKLISDKSDKIKIKEPAKNKISGSQAYTLAAQVFPENFYIQLTAKMYEAFNNKGARGSKNTLEYPEVKIFKELHYPNKISFKNVNNSGYLIVNGKRFTASGTGLDFVSKVITELFQAEAKKEVSIIRPEGHSLKSDRLEFSKCEGTFLTRLSNNISEVSTESGNKRRSFAGKGNINSEWMVTQEQVDEVDNFDESKFDKHSNSACTYYTKKNLKCIDFTEHCTSVIDTLRCIFQSELNLDRIARDPIFGFLLEEHRQDPFIICVYKDTLWVIEWHEHGWSMAKKKTINFPKVRFV